MPAFHEHLEKIRNWMENHWNNVFAKELSLTMRALIMVPMSVFGILFTYVLQKMTGHFFSSIDLFVVILIAVYAGPMAGVISGVGMTLSEDFLFLDPVGRLLDNSESVERFFVLCALNLLISVFAYSIRTGYNKTILAKQEAERARQEADRVNQTKSIFLATVSHEIRTPLNGIIGLSDVLRKSNLSTEESRFAEMIHESGKTLLKIINDILDYSKIEAGKIDLEFSEFSIADVVNQVVLSLSPRALEKTINLDSVIDQNIPKILRGDSSRISQILYNLLGNAIKFTSTGSVVIKVRLESLTANEKARIFFSVTDTGRGISKEQQNKLFQPFTQLQKTGTTGEPGTGLGLSICRQILKTMNSDIYVDSIVEQGSRFYFVLELDVLSKEVLGLQIKDRNMSFDYKKSEIKPLFPRNRKPSILVVEDNPTNQATAQAMLERLGASVIIASNGSEALDLVTQTKLDLILMDCQMPVMDGYEATAQIRKNKINIPIVAMTANAYKEDQKSCFDAGMIGFVSKPLTLDSLTSAILPILKPDANGISADTLEDLEAAIGPSGKTKVIQAFLSGFPEMRENLTKSLGSSDLLRLQSMGHRYKSSAHTVGAHGLAFLFNQLEQETNADSAAQIVSKIEEASGEVQAKLNQHVI